MMTIEDIYKIRNIASSCRMDLYAIRRLIANMDTSEAEIQKLNSKILDVEAKLTEVEQSLTMHELVNVPSLNKR